MLSLFTSITHFIESGFSWHTLVSGEMAAICLVFVFAILSNLERHAPKVERSHSRLVQSYRTNLGMFAFNSILFSFLSVSSLFFMTEGYFGNGLLNAIPSPVLKGVLSFLLLDLLLYLWHKACHSFDSLWLFHRVHHNDPYINVSTAFRIHLVELMVTSILKAAYIILLGIDKTVVLAYEAVYPFFVMFHHANISFRGEALLGHLVITPYLHRAHHSKERKEHDSNYGAIFSLWDRLLGTMILVEPAEIGIKGDSPQTLWGLIKFGFKASAPVAPVSARGINIDAMIAEAAYYRAEKRSFSPGNELYDWLEAKKEIISQVYGNKRVNI